MGGDKHQVLEMTEENRLAWKVKEDLPARTSRLGGMQSVVKDGKVMLIDGCAQTWASSVMMHDERTDTWTNAPPLPWVLSRPAGSGIKALNIGEGGEDHVVLLLFNGCWARRPNGEWVEWPMIPMLQLPQPPTGQGVDLLPQHFTTAHLLRG